MRWTTVFRILLMTAATFVCMGAAYALTLSGFGLLEDVKFKFVSAPEVPGFNEELAFPCNIEGTNLTALALISYEGTFLEDGSDTEVADISSILLRNDGTGHIHDAQIQIVQGERVLHFELTHLPVGAEILVLEKDQKAFLGNSISSCSGIARYENENYWKSRFTLGTSDRRSLLVKNITAVEIRNITVYYKAYYEPGDFYMGGLTHNIQINGIDADEEVLLMPFPYSSEGSRVIWISYEE